MLSDVPIGAFLSGGVDSSTVAAIMQSESNSPIETFSIGFNEMGYDEAQYANQVAKHLNTNHTEVYLDSKDALSIIPNLPEIYDEPFADSSQIPTFLLSQITKKKVTVALSGDGGDEIFGGYNRYFIAGGLWKRMALLPTPVRNIISSSIHSMSPSTWDRIYSLIKGAIPNNRRIELIGDKLYKSASILTCDNESKLYNRLTQLSYPSDFVLGERYINKFDVKHYTSQNPVAQMMILDTLGYLSDDILTKVDRAAMANSLESRMPLLDHRIFEFAWKLPHNYKIRNGTGKWLLRQLLYRYVPKNLIERPKMGFGIPVDDWLRGPLKEWSGDLLSTSRLKKEGYLNNAHVKRMWEEHQAKKRNWGANLWTVLMFESWLNNVKK
jgi:asparagine synthase (glutamine-hydrolysing)